VWSSELVPTITVDNPYYRGHTTTAVRAEDAVREFQQWHLNVPSPVDQMVREYLQPRRDTPRPLTAAPFEQQQGTRTIQELTPENCRSRGALRDATNRSGRVPDRLFLPEDIWEGLVAQPIPGRRWPPAPEMIFNGIPVEVGSPARMEWYSSAELESEEDIAADPPTAPYAPEANPPATPAAEPVSQWEQYATVPSVGSPIALPTPNPREFYQEYWNAPAAEAVTAPPQSGRPTVRNLSDYERSSRRQLRDIIHGGDRRPSRVFLTRADLQRLEISSHGTSGALFFMGVPVVITDIATGRPPRLEWDPPPAAVSELTQDQLLCHLSHEIQAARGRGMILLRQPVRKALLDLIKHSPELFLTLMHEAGHTVLKTTTVQRGARGARLTLNEQNL